MEQLRRLVMLVSLLGVGMFALSGPGTRLGWWTWQTGFAWMKWAMYAGFGAAAVALVLLLIPRTRGPRPSFLVASLLVGVLAGAPIISLMNQAKSVPAIHDITTDTMEPPAFVTLAAERRASPNGLAYAGAEVAAKQQAAYPNVQAVRLPLGRDAAFSRALEAARAMGWEIVAADAAGGRIEATATTFWFGFKDDVVVRLRGDGDGTRVDVRSMSRVGKSDVGANARRIKQYLSRLA
jgi:uncharacterized protein (DUF1499 family)